MQTPSVEDARQEIPLLLYPPLIEAIFELHWELQRDPQTGRLRDPAYPMLYGRLYERFQKELPFTEDLPSVQMHPEESPYIVRHRMRKEKEGYPLIQVGPGIVTANEAKGYSWDSLQALISQLTHAVVESSPKAEHPTRLIKCELRYLNAVRLDPAQEDPLGFLAEKLHMQLDMNPDLLRSNQLYEPPVAVNLNFAYPLKKPLGHFALSINLGHAENQPAYIVQTLIRSTEESVPHPSAFADWAAEAHRVASNSFLSLCKGSLMERFCGL